MDSTYQNRITNILMLLILIGVVFLMVKARNSTAPDYNKEIARLRLDSIAKENTRLTKDIEFQTSEKIRFKSKLDSLAALPPKIKETYKKKADEIDNSHVTKLVSEFDKLFANGTNTP